MTKHYFAYGTLMCADLMHAVAGHCGRPVPGTLRDYRRQTVKGEVYPGIRPQPGTAVEGVVYGNLPSDAWTRLDVFEGDLYQRQLVQVDLADGTTMAAYTYVVKPEFEHRLEATEWDAGQFLRTGKKTFVAHYAGFKALKHRAR
jgi:gamma-glutamylcyclotransferase (GGCT)/AIG2-like uncharacterized protein YtfP